MQKKELCLARDAFVQCFHLSVQRVDTPLEYTIKKNPTHIHTHNAQLNVLKTCSMCTEHWKYKFYYELVVVFRIHQSHFLYRSFIFIHLLCFVFSLPPFCLHYSAFLCHPYLFTRFNVVVVYFAFMTYEIFIILEISTFFSLTLQ